MQTIFLIISSISFVAPFLIWSFIRFQDKVANNYRSWHKPFIIGSFIIGFLMFGLFLTLALILFT